MMRLNEAIFIYVSKGMIINNKLTADKQYIYMFLISIIAQQVRQTGQGIIHQSVDRYRFLIIVGTF